MLYWKIFDELPAFSTWITWVKNQLFCSHMLTLLCGQFLADFRGKKKDRIAIQHFDCWHYDPKLWKCDFTVEKKRQNKLSLTTRKKRKPVSSCREKWLNEKFFRLRFAHFDNFFAVRQRQKERKTTSEPVNWFENQDFIGLSTLRLEKRQNMLRNIEFKSLKLKFIR